MLLAMLLSIPLGLLASRKPGGVLDRFLTTISLVGLSMPQFFLGSVMVILFTVKLPWFQTGVGTGRHTSSCRRCASPCPRWGACRWWCARR